MHIHLVSYLWFYSRDQIHNGATLHVAYPILSIPCLLMPWRLNTLRPRRNRHHFADDIFKCIFVNESVWILLIISLKFVPKFQINNIPALVQIMVWRRPGDKPLSGSMMISLLTHICVTRPQWVKSPGHLQVWYWPNKPEYSVSSIRWVNFSWKIFSM